MTQSTENKDYLETTARTIFRTIPEKFALSIVEKDELKVKYQTNIPFSQFFNENKELQLQGFLNERSEENFQDFYLDEKQPWSYRINLNALTYVEDEDTISESGDMVETIFEINSLLNIGEFEFTDLTGQLTLNGSVTFDVESQSIDLVFESPLGQHYFKDVLVSLDMNFMKIVRIRMNAFA